LRTYNDRIKRALARGYSVSQARGKPRKGELSITEMEKGFISEKKQKELREISLQQRRKGEKPLRSKWRDIPQSLIEELDHASRNFIFGY
jgi:hypothetical protein